MQIEIINMHKFTYDFLKKNGVSTSLFSLSNIIVDLKAKMDNRKSFEHTLFAKLESVAILESVKGSNAIEGIFTTESRIKEIVEQNAEPLTHSEEEIAGYHDAIKFINDNAEYLDFNEETVLKIHELLTARHGQYTKSGHYKTEDNVIAEKNPDGTIKRVIFVPTKAKDTKQAMVDLFLAYQVARGDMEIPTLLLIPCVIVDFLSIHPFSDGNGRVSRLLTLLFLKKNGFDIGQYISFENQINEYRTAYYDSLHASQLNWHDSKNDYVPFIEFTFQILYICYKEINKRFLITKSNKNKKNERIEALLLNSIVPLSKQEIVDFLPDISVTTIEATLSNLIKQNKIKKIGTFKFAKYIKR